MNCTNSPKKQKYNSQHKRTTLTPEARAIVVIKEILLVSCDYHHCHQLADTNRYQVNLIG